MRRAYCAPCVWPGRWETLKRPSRRLCKGEVMRRRNTAAILAIAVVALAAVASVGVAPSTSAVAAKNCSCTLRVGDVLPFTGGLTAYGANLDRAVKVGIALQNAGLKKDGLAGKIQVKLVGSEDGQTQASASVEAATKLVKSNKANVLIGEMAWR